jgi:DNA-binding MarR family transcriptional regulator
MLEEAPAGSMNSLAERTMTDQSTVSVTVTKLEARGLVHRDPSAVDARRTTVAITAHGKQSLAEAPPTVQARLTNALQQLTPDELSAVAHGLARLVMLMDATDAPATPLFEGDATGSP